MTTENGASQKPWPIRRPARWVWLGVTVAAVALAGWYFGFAVPAREAAELAAQRAANARTIPDLNLDLVWIAPGDFMMGTPGPTLFGRLLNAAHAKFAWIPGRAIKGDDIERPQTRVRITKAFWLGRTDVTQAQYEAVMGNNPSMFKGGDDHGGRETIAGFGWYDGTMGINPPNFKGADLPVETVGWDEATAFCRRLTERERAAGRLPAGYRYTLPTEAQWEYACRAGTTGDYAGSLDAMGWYQPMAASTTYPVGTKQPNAWGLFDMHGNVREWCSNLHDVN